MSTTKDIRTRDEIIVTVGKRDDRNADADVNRRRRGAPQTTKPNDGILHRRKSRRLFNFYDAGQYFDSGSSQFVDFDFGTQTAITSEFLTPQAINPIDGTRWAAIAADITAIANRATNFKKIIGPDAEKFGVQLAINNGDFEAMDESNSKFTADGYKPEASSISRLRFQYSMLGFDFDTDGAVKITSLPLYTAPAVPLAIGQTANFFIAPLIGCFLCDAIFGENLNWIGTYYDIYPRSLLDLPEGSAFATDGGGARNIINNARLNTYLATVRANGLSRNYYTVDTINVLSGGSVPDAPAGTSTAYHIFPGGGLAGTGGVVGADGYGKPGTLLLILESGGHSFYIWSTEDRISFIPSPLDMVIRQE